MPNIIKPKAIVTIAARHPGLQALRVVSRCLLDTANDCVVSEAYESKTLHCICQAKFSEISPPSDQSNSAHAFAGLCALRGVAEGADGLQQLVDSGVRKDC